MNDLAKRLAALSPQKRHLLIQKIRQSGVDFNIFPASFAQQRLWFLHHLAPALYTIQGLLHLHGRLQIAALRHSLTALIERHEALRTTFLALDGQPFQVIQPPQPLAPALVDLQDVPAAERDALLAQRCQAAIEQPFDISDGPLLRVVLFRLAPDRHALLVVLHHAIADGWSLDIFVRELAALYQASVTDTPADLPPLPIQYADVARWQHDLLQPAVLDPLLAYWRQQLHAPLPVLALPTDRPRPPSEASAGAQHELSIAPTLNAALHDLSRREGVTLFMTLLAAFQVVLHRYTGQADLIVGSPVAGRTRAETEGLIGCFINTLPLRMDLSGNPTFRELLARVRALCLAAYQHQDLPFEKLVEDLQLTRGLGDTPVFQVMFALRQQSQALVRLPDLTMTAEALHNGTAKFELTLDLVETPAGLSGWIEYSTDLFDAATIARMAGHYQTILEQIVAAPQPRIAALPLLTPAEHQQLRAWQGPHAAYPVAATLPARFAAIAARTPHAIA
ncbi:MAG TPA: condensation domain-containing protein, partial [Herpetosiphonaceae bacterium]